MPFIMPDDGLSDMNNVLVQRAGGMSLTTISQRLTPDEVMDKLEERVGPEGRKLFEQFLRKVNKLQAQQHLESRGHQG
jgi:hypothetical protein